MIKAAFKMPGFSIGFVMTFTFVTAALVSFFWTPYGVDGVDIVNKLHTPDG